MFNTQLLKIASSLYLEKYCRDARLHYNTLGVSLSSLKAHKVVPPGKCEQSSVNRAVHAKDRGEGSKFKVLVNLLLNFDLSKPFS